MLNKGSKKVSSVRREKIAITGLGGVIGQVLGNELSGYEIVDLFNTRKYSGKSKKIAYKHLNLIEQDDIEQILDESKPDVIIHMAAITHIDACEVDRENGKEGIVWKINVRGTEEIAKFSAKNKIPLIFLSTECVFDGKKGYYEEEAKKNPISWYGVTKHEAEEKILAAGAPASIIRSVVTYHKNDEVKTIYGKFLQELRNKKSLNAVADQLFTPTYTFDIVKAIKKIVEQKLQGIYHVAPRTPITPYDFALLVAESNKFPKRFVNKAKLKSLYGKERAALRLKNSSLSAENSIRKLKFIPRSPRLVLQSISGVKNNESNK